MKKLMIATAAIALGASGAYATEGCCGVAASESETCKANVYQVKMSLKTLTPKTVKKNGCTGLYFDQGTRTIDGYIWTCCDPCGTVQNTEPYQITLWEKAAQIGIINGVGKNTGGTATQKYTVTVTYKTAGGAEASTTLPDEYDFSEIDQAAQNFIAGLTGAIFVKTSAAPVGGTVTTLQWTDDTLVSALNTDTELCRFGKTANKVAVQFEVDGVGVANPPLNYIPTTDVQDPTLYKFVAAGFGTFDTKSMVAKSVSGNVVGTLPSLDLCDDYADVAGICDDFESWCDYATVGGGVNEMAIPAYGTWTAKYVKKMGSLYNAVPVYDRQAL